MLKKLLFACFAFAVLSLTILHRPAWKLNDFDQGFYATIAYDLNKHGVFSNGPFAKVDSTVARPCPYRKPKTADRKRESADTRSR